MKKFIILAICCALPLVILGIILLTKQKPSVPVEAEQSAIKVGSAFPDFQVTEAGGREITLGSLSGKPAIVWFTTSWCVPCQIGAREVSRLDNELGGQAFDVLVIFVDLRETNSDLINWRQQFANQDWLVAFDNQTTLLAQKVDLKFLDSKFLLDRNGLIRNINFQIADDQYLNLIREVFKKDNG